MSEVIEFLPQRRIRHGMHALEHLQSELHVLGGRKVLLLSTPPLDGSSLVSDIIGRLGSACRVVLPVITSHAPVDQVLGAASVAADSGVDTVVAVGGGSVIDAAKVVAACLHLERFDSDIVNHPGLLGKARSDWGLESWRCNVLAIPTTLAAAEFTHLAGIAVQSESRKAILAHPRLTPASVLLDPEAIAGTPLPLLLSSGIRALDHAVERVCSIHPHPFGHVLSIEAVRLLVNCLRAVFRAPESPQARADCQYAAWLSMAGFCVPSPFGASHGVGYLLGVAKGVEHGLTSCVYLPAVLAYNEGALGGVRDELALALGGQEGDSPAVLIRALVGSLGLPTTYGELGLSLGDLADVAGMYDGSGPIATNPRAIGGSEQLLKILESAC